MKETKKKFRNAADDVKDAILLGNIILNAAAESKLYVPKNTIKSNEAKLYLA